MCSLYFVNVHRFLKQIYCLLLALMFCMVFVLVVLWYHEADYTRKLSKACKQREIPVLCQSSVQMSLDAILFVLFKCSNSNCLLLRGGWGRELFCCERQICLCLVWQWEYGYWVCMCGCEIIWKIIEIVPVDHDCNTCLIAVVPDKYTDKTYI